MERGKRRTRRMRRTRSMRSKMGHEVLHEREAIERNRKKYRERAERERERERESEGRTDRWTDGKRGQMDRQRKDRNKDRHAIRTEIWAFYIPGSMVGQNLGMLNLWFRDSV